MAEENKYNGHVLNREQANTLANMIKLMKGLHEIDKEDDPYMADTVDGLVTETEELVYQLGEIDKKIF